MSGDGGGAPQGMSSATLSALQHGQGAAGGGEMLGGGRAAVMLGFNLDSQEHIAEQVLSTQKASVVNVFGQGGMVQGVNTMYSNKGPRTLGKFLSALGIGKIQWVRELIDHTQGITNSGGQMGGYIPESSLTGYGSITAPATPDMGHSSGLER